MLSIIIIRSFKLLIVRSFNFFPVTLSGHIFRSRYYFVCFYILVHALLYTCICVFLFITGNRPCAGGNKNIVGRCSSRSRVMDSSNQCCFHCLHSGHTVDSCPFKISIDKSAKVCYRCCLPSRLGTHIFHERFAFGAKCKRALVRSKHTDVMRQCSETHITYNMYMMYHTYNMYMMYLI